MDKVKPKLKGIQQFQTSKVNRKVFTGKEGCGPIDGAG
jgi:hypothetical protein